MTSQSPKVSPSRCLPICVTAGLLLAGLFTVCSALVCPNSVPVIKSNRTYGRMIRYIGLSGPLIWKYTAHSLYSHCGASGKFLRPAILVAQRRTTRATVAPFWPHRDRQGRSEEHTSE